ncbi:dTDP-4-dehydrorhamnose reductase [Reinekea blandensis]|uniref:dTDP-4-dehydrorhamnose reductase n=1 Tax=Reinekea blandensis MED297 TaxID=314283 RepID=A4BIY0_9GAMM|nr:dTDP-4-dehydrorhamnose reductase [Reinekea blandensis]EAR07913.1 dTDP-4-dehydrorhamnose reductase [Reinekea sp. MED297] [Reinekea blandensis MED297]
MTVLITGGTGQVGFELQRTLAVFGDIVAPTPEELDLADASAVERFLEQTHPTIVVNAAAYTAVDKAEEEPELAQALNADLPAQLANYCARQSAWLVHYSTDYVYDGAGESFRTEDHPVNPLSVYGKTKLAGDNAIEASGAQHFIFRTSWVYGARGHNFVKTMLRLGESKSELNVVNDQIGAPTTARLIAQVTSQALAQRNAANIGLYHLVCRETCNWQGFAQAIFQQASELGKALAITPQAVAGIPTSDYPTPAKRPLNSRLIVSKLEETFKLKLPTWQSQLQQVLEEMQSYGVL